MNSFVRLLCLAALATAAFAQTPDTAPACAAPAPAPFAPAEVTTQAPAAPALELRSNPEPTVLPTATVFRLKLDHSISTASARPGEPFTATLTQPVSVDGQTVIPAGAVVHCRVDRAHSARRFSGKPSLSIKALSVQMPGAEELNFTASVVDTSNPRHLDVDEEGNVRGASPNPLNKVELGSFTAVGAIAGTVVAGPEGLLIGAASGAAVATGHIIIKRRDLTLPAGTELIFELDASATTAARPQMGGMQ